MRMRFFTAIRHAVRTVNEGFRRGAKVEREFNEEMTCLLRSRGDYEIVKASKYTENPLVYLGADRVKGKPTDYLVIFNGTTLAAVEVTTGSAGYSYQGSQWILIAEDKLLRMDCFNAGYVVEKVLLGEPHFIWASSEDIRRDKSALYGETWRTDIRIWKPNLDGLAEELVRLAESVDC